MESDLTKAVAQWRRDDAELATADLEAASTVAWDLTEQQRALAARWITLAHVSAGRDSHPKWELSDWINLAGILLAGDIPDARLAWVVIRAITRAARQ